jgi:GAF domain-containing protein
MQQSADLDSICGQLDRRETDSATFLEAMTRHVATAFNCSRVGVWFFRDDPGGRLLRCESLYDANKNQMDAAPDRRGAECGAYFEAILGDGSVVALFARVHPAMQGFIDYLQRHDVQSVLDVCISVNGVALGAISCEQVGTPRAWTQRQLNALRQIGARASLALMHSAHVPLDSAPGALWGSGTPSQVVATSAPPAPADP